LEASYNGIRPTQGPRNWCTEMWAEENPKSECGYVMYLIDPYGLSRKAADLG
jgi:hypothetical protein